MLRFVLYTNGNVLYLNRIRVFLVIEHWLISDDFNIINDLKKVGEGIDLLNILK